MARFRASILRTNKTRVSRQDQVSIETHTCGERVGIRVHAYVHPETGKDVLVVFLTGGRQDPAGKRVGVYVEGAPVKRTVMVEVSGGVAEFTTVPDGIEAIMVDWDSCEDLLCPLCGEPVGEGWGIGRDTSLMHPSCERRYLVIQEAAG